MKGEGAGAWGECRRGRGRVGGGGGARDGNWGLWRGRGGDGVWGWPAVLASMTLRRAPLRVIVFLYHSAPPPPFPSPFPALFTPRYPDCSTAAAARGVGRARQPRQRHEHPSHPERSILAASTHPISSEASPQPRYGCQRLPLAALSQIDPFAPSRVAFQIWTGQRGTAPAQSRGRLCARTDGAPVGASTTAGRLWPPPPALIPFTPSPSPPPPCALRLPLFSFSSPPPPPPPPLSYSLCLPPDPRRRFPSPGAPCRGPFGAPWRHRWRCRRR